VVESVADVSVEAQAAPAATAAPAAAPARKSPPKKLSAVAPSTAATSAKSATSATSAAAPSSAPPQATAPVAAASPAPNPGVTMGIPELRSLWPAILEALKGYGRVSWMLFADSAPMSLDNGVLAVGVKENGKLENIRQSRHDERLRQAIIDVARLDARIDVVLAPDLISAAAATTPVEAPASPASASAAPSAPSEPDAPSLDDETLDDSSGVDLALRALGATQIGEIEH
jgi:hypothetical protein